MLLPYTSVYLYMYSVVSPSRAKLFRLKFHSAHSRIMEIGKICIGVALNNNVFFFFVLSIRKLNRTFFPPAYLYTGERSEARAHLRSIRALPSTIYMCDRTIACNGEFHIASALLLIDSTSGLRWPNFRCIYTRESNCTLFAYSICSRVTSSVTVSCCCCCCYDSWRRLLCSCCCCFSHGKGDACIYIEFTMGYVDVRVIGCFSSNSATLELFWGNIKV